MHRNIKILSCISPLAFVHTLNRIVELDGCDEKSVAGLVERCCEILTSVHGGTTAACWEACGLGDYAKYTATPEPAPALPPTDYEV